MSYNDIPEELSSQVRDATLEPLDGEVANESCLAATEEIQPGDARLIYWD